MLKLAGKAIVASPFASSGQRAVLRIRTSDDGLGAYLSVDANLVSNEDDSSLLALQARAGSGTAMLSRDFEHLRAGDLVAINSRTGRFRVIYRKASRHNSFLVTERCDHYCLMCSQPPKDVDDRWIAAEILEAIPLISPDTTEIGFTGGEPTLLGDTFLQILDACADHLPNTAVHVLSNGRRFADESFAAAWSAVAITDLMVGIPVYSDVSSIHDYVVQADGAFDGTLRGILNLKKYGARVEIRIVLHKQTIGRITQLAEFIARNLTFVDHVALMGLEITGFTRANLDALWIDPFEYRHALTHVSTLLTAAGLRVSIYNHPLCIIEREA